MSRYGVVCGGGGHATFACVNTIIIIVIFACVCLCMRVLYKYMHTCRPPLALFVFVERFTHKFIIFEYVYRMSGQLNFQMPVAMLLNLLSSSTPPVGMCTHQSTILSQSPPPSIYHFMYYSKTILFNLIFQTLKFSVLNL